MDLNQKLSENFTLKEFVRSNTASRLGIDNTPGEKELENLRHLCEKVLQPVRDKISKDNPNARVRIRITSGYRSPVLNSRLGSNPSSFHVFGMAADCELYIDDEENNSLLYHTIKDEVDFTELIWEYGDDESPDWVHVALNVDSTRKMIKRFPKGKKVIE